MKGLPVVLVVLFAAATAFAGGQDPPLPDGEGKTIASRTCTACHGLDLIASKHVTRADWQATLETMKGYGAALSDTEVTTLLDYLAGHYGPKDAPPAPALANDAVKSATAKDTSEMTVTVDSDATVHLPPMTVPFSSLASPEAKAKFLEDVKAAKKRDPRDFLKMSIAQKRQSVDERNQPALDRVKQLFAVDSVPATIAGVYTDIITPKGGIAARNTSRLLINLHGGGFEVGARSVGALESIPIASLAKMKVVTVDYRQGPEYKFPAASEDVAAVYKELLKSYKPQNIGIYGCSAGGALTGEVAAWLQKEKLPTPGAIGIFCASAEGWIGGDSGVLIMPLSGMMPAPQSQPHRSVGNVAYFSDVNVDDPLVMPGRSDAVMVKFPPTLIISSTRDFAMSSAIHTHAQLVRLGVDAELHIWEALSHGFLALQPDLPESREAWNVIVKFFDAHLGTE